MRSWRVIPAVFAAVALSACSDSIPGPGTMTLTLEGPFVSEGAALISVFGSGITGVTQIHGRVFGEHDADSFIVVIVAEPAAQLRFGLTVLDTLASFEAHVLQVAAPHDVLRNVLAEYTVDIRR
jgi:hypothetical protein